MINIKELIKKQYKDITDKQILIKKFFKTIYRDIDFNSEYIRVFQSNKEGTYKKANFYNNIDDLVSFSTNKYSFLNNTYFSLSTTDVFGGAEENLQYRYCIAFDFDKKDLGSEFNHKDIINLFKENKLYCHCIIDSGNGYHCYIMINKTNNLKMVDEVQKALVKKLGADDRADLKTQILRIPYTYNCKGEKAKEVKLVHLESYDSDKFKAYDIEFLHQKNCINNREIKTDNKIINYTLKGDKLPICVENMLQNGSLDNEKNKDLQSIVVALRMKGYSLNEIQNIVKEWDIKSNYKDNTSYRVDYIFNNMKHFICNKESIHCDRDKCKNIFKDEVITTDTENLIMLEEKILNDIRAKKTKVKDKNGKLKERFKLLGKHLLILGIIKDSDNCINRINLDSTLKGSMGKTTVSGVIRDLEEEGYITIIKGNKRKKESDIYKLNEFKKNELKDIWVSFAVMRDVINGVISESDLRVYITLRKIQREKGKGYAISQSKLADELGVTQGRISQSINNLIKADWIAFNGLIHSENSLYPTNLYRIRA